VKIVQSLDVVEEHLDQQLTLLLLLASRTQASREPKFHHAEDCIQQASPSVLVHQPPALWVVLVFPHQLPVPSMSTGCASQPTLWLDGGIGTRVVDVLDVLPGDVRPVGIDVLQ